jgi:hypothetical protein
MVENPLKRWHLISSFFNTSPFPRFGKVLPSVLHTRTRCTVSQFGVRLYWKRSVSAVRPSNRFAPAGVYNTHGLFQQFFFWTTVIHVTIRYLPPEGRISFVHSQKNIFRGALPGERSRCSICNSMLLTLRKLKLLQSILVVICWEKTITKSSTSIWRELICEERSKSNSFLKPHFEGNDRCGRKYLNYNVSPH